MKIGIITFWQSQDNYGQILQCWALQHFLMSIGHDAYLIRYTHTNPKPLLKEQLKKILKVYPVLKKILNLLCIKKKSLQLVSHQRCFDDFKNKNIKQSSIVYRNLSDLQKNPPQADCYIVGSDQVWAQLLYTSNNETYFLNFGDKKIKRISYAASFAMEEYPQKMRQRLSKQLQRFDAISVREKSGVRICDSVGVKAELVLDPTFLLGREFYMRFITGNRNDNYVFFYVLNINSPEDIYWEQLSSFFQSQQYKMIVTTASGFNQISFELKDCIYEYPTIEQWLSLIYNSALVVTTSFHGVALSIKLNKPFLFIPLSGPYAGSNNRVLDLLDALGLSERVIHNAHECTSRMEQAIMWDEVNVKLNKLIESSRFFLTKNLKS